jgi:hypothetical protein
MSPRQQSDVSIDSAPINPGKANDSPLVTVPESVQQKGLDVSTEPFLSLQPNNTTAVTMPNSITPGKATGLDGLFLHSYEALSPESLRITSNWGDGTYDLVSDDLSFAMGPGDTFLGLNSGDYQLFGSEIETIGTWPTL